MNIEKTNIQTKFVCENCGRTNDGSYGSGRFCSKSCRCSAAAKKIKTRKTPFTLGHNRAPYGTWKCRVCGLIFETKNALWKHMHDQHPEDIKEFQVKGSIGWNKGLTKETDVRIANASKKLHDGYETGRLTPSFLNKHHSKESKMKMSSSRKKYLSDNPNKHPWKNSSKFKSVPCEKVKNQLRLFGLTFTEEYKPLEDRNFSIDIAFLDVKIGLEINGNQHYSDHENGILSEYYQERHDLIEADGWKLIEIHYANVYHKDFIRNLLVELGLLSLA